MFYVIRSNGTRTNLRSTYVKNNSYPWIPQTADTYGLGVDIRDRVTGEVVSRVKNVVVSPITYSPLKLAVYRTGFFVTYRVGVLVDLAARAEGGSGDYEYMFFVILSNGTRTNLRSTFVKNNSYPWIPRTPDNYQLGVEIRDRITGESLIEVKPVTITP